MQDHAHVDEAAVTYGSDNKNTFIIVSVFYSDFTVSQNSSFLSFLEVPSYIQIFTVS